MCENLSDRQIRWFAGRCLQIGKFRDIYGNESAGVHAERFNLPAGQGQGSDWVFLIGFAVVMPSISREPAGVKSNQCYRMKNKSKEASLKRDLARLFRNMDFVSKHPALD